MTTNPIPRVRSALFIPAHRGDFLAAADRRGADAVILDLEDGVPAGEHAAACDRARTWLAGRTSGRTPAALARVHPWGHPLLDKDLDAVVRAGLLGVALPKVAGPEDVVALSERLAWWEGRRDLTPGTVRIWPLLESAAAVLAAGPIAHCSPRLAFLGGAAAEGGDLAAGLGYRSSPDRLETLHLRSHVLLAARAAGVPNPMTGLVTTLDDPAAVTRFARQSRQLGYDGMMVIHPAHVPLVNEAFDHTPEEIALARATRDALGSAGGAQRVGDRMVDTAMSAAAARVLGHDEPSVDVADRPVSGG